VSLGKPAVDADCGGIYYAVKFSIPEKYANEVGHIIQRVAFSITVTDCGGHDIRTEKSKEMAKQPWFEAWDFAENAVTPEVQGRNDIFFSPDFGMCTKGRMEWIGEVKGFPSHPLPVGLVPGAVAGALELPSTHDEPRIWSKTGQGAAHRLEVEWDCCVSPPQHTRVVTVDP